jgi:Fur family peroxide stress response transcriptional regulator
MLDLERALEALSRAGLRRTPQRVAVIESLVGDHSHPTAETVWERVRMQLPSLSLSTVYATLRELESLGLVQRVSDDPLRVDPDAATHAHLTCEICERVVDVPDEGADEAAREAGRRDGHTVRRIVVSLDGVCDRCRGQRARRIPKS